MDANLLFQTPPSPDADGGKDPNDMDDERGDSL